MGVARIFFEGGNTFRKFLKIFLRKLQKIMILAYFSKELTNHALDFCGLGPKTQIVGKFWEIFRKYSKIFVRKWQKCIILAYFQKILTNHSLNFCALGQKAQIVVKFWENSENSWWNFYRTIYFLFLFLFFKICY